VFYRTAIIQKITKCFYPLMRLREHIEGIFLIKGIKLFRVELTDQQG